MSKKTVVCLCLEGIYIKRLYVTYGNPENPLTLTDSVPPNTSFAETYKFPKVCLLRLSITIWRYVMMNFFPSV
ncbi:hypothetical protein CJ030_MR5G024982 [Morella rubra]|uniref:Uncharacterized protein n=1 Tax=Morella rubra TaxID=262757 RepID=A0A6A1VHL1_9ROSI|nr:hypothetical protein CJ030_MR5G024982 [Morella rubra]